MFDREIEDQVEIVASPAEVWWQLTNLSGYSNWNPFIIDARGSVCVGRRLTLTIKPDGMPPIVIRPRVIVAEPEQELRWRGRLGFPNLLDGEHTFLIESTGLNRVRFTQREAFSGLLAPGTLAVATDVIAEGFRRMNEALRQRAEAAHATRAAARAHEESSHQRQMAGPPGG